MAHTTALLQTITKLEGEGIDSPTKLDLSYTVPQGCTAGVQYVRAGNTAEGMINITVLRDGKVMRAMSPSRQRAPCMSRSPSWTS